jgi:hypothetical protein
MICCIINIFVLVLLNLFFIGLLIWGAVYISKSPVPLQPCIYIQSTYCGLPNPDTMQEAKMEFLYSNNITDMIYAYYYISIYDGCLNNGNCCTDGYDISLGKGQYCLINRYNDTLIDNWYMYPSGPNIVYLAPLLIGIFGLLIANITYTIYFCSYCNNS